MVSRRVKTFEFVFLLLTSIFCLFCFCETNFDGFTIFSKLFDLIKNALFMEIYILMESSGLSLTKYSIIMRKRRRKKLSFNCLKRPFFPIFSCFESNYVLIALVYGKIKKYMNLYNLIRTL